MTILLLSTSSVMDMVVPSSHRTHRPWVVGCCMGQFNPLAPRVASSNAGQANPNAQRIDMAKERIRNLFSNVDLSVSSYDTAWVAMVPSLYSPKFPCFPECLKWLMDNQLNDGSWGLIHKHPRSIKDALSSTLASIVALKRWNVGEDHINKGLYFIESNFDSATDKDQPSPFGFDIIFPSMLEYAKDLNIMLPFKQEDLNFMIHKREAELRRCDSKEMEAYFAYISEGLGNFYDWNMVSKYQLKNGSIFNSPSATAAALIHHENAGCCDYLISLLDKFGNAVPTVYPLDLYARLSMVDTLERLGIARHLSIEIQTVLDETYRCWLQRDEQIFMDIVTCALAFRVLRRNGYEVSSDPFAEIAKEGAYLNSPVKDDVYAALEVYRALQILHQEELSFGELKFVSADFLKLKVSTDSNRLSKYINIEMDDALKFPFYTSLERVSTRRNIQNYILNDTRTLKSTYRSSNISNEDYLMLAVEDYNSCQSIYREELKDLERWVVENKMDKLKYARQKMPYCYISVASTLSSPELSDARITWAKSRFLVILIDDFFNVEGSIDELVNLIQCVEKWNVNVDTDCCSEVVRILFLALKRLVCWIGDTGFKWQARDVTSNVIQNWLALMKSMLREATRERDGLVPTIDEYIQNAYVSCTLVTFVLPALFFIGPKLSDDVVQSKEYHNLYEIMSTHSRLTNDIRTFKRDFKEGKLNAVTLHKNYGKNGSDEEEIIEEIKMMIKNLERKLMQLVLLPKDSIVPRACKDVFWKMCCVDIFFDATDDGFTENKILDSVQEVIYEPVSMPVYLTE